MTSPSEPRTRSLYHAAPPLTGALAIVAGAVATIYLTQLVCASLGAPPIAQVGTSMAVVIAGMLALARHDYRVVGLARPRVKHVVAGALVGLSAWYVGLWLTIAFPVPGNEVELEHLASQTALAPSILVLALMPAIGEELVFRGVLARALARRIPVALAIVVSAVAFSAYHLAPGQMIATLPLGLSLGLLAIRSDSILPGAVAHAINNTIALLLVRDLGDVVARVAENHPVLSLVVACVVLAGGLLLGGVSGPTSRTSAS